MPSNCTVCSLAAGDDIVNCVACKRSFHLDCAKITSNELDYMRDNKLVWKCEFCLRGGRKLRSGSVPSADPTVSDSGCSDTQATLSLILQEIRDIKNTQQSIYADINVIKKSQSKLRDEFHKRCLAIEKDVAGCSSLLSEHTVDLASHNSRIAEIEDGVRNVCGKVSEIAVDLQKRSSPSSESIVGDVVAELAERESRRRNLIIFRMPESLEADAQARKRADEESVRKLLDDLNCAVNISQDQLRVIRIGSRKEGGIRPLKIVLPSEEVVNKVVQNASRLRRMTQYGDIALSVDKTPIQRQQYRQTKEQLDARVARGERGLRIRQIGGLARIVKEN